MGVKGLFQFLKRFEKDISIKEFCEGGSVAIDIFWFIHQSKGDLFALQNMILPILKNSAEVHCVFDGLAPPEKKVVLEQHTKKRHELLKTIERIEIFMSHPFTILRGEDRNTVRCYINDLRKQAWAPSPQYVECVRQWLTGKGCFIYQADGEADEVLVELEKCGRVTAIFTNDSDLLTLGAMNIIRLHGPTRGALLDTRSICENIGFTMIQWSDFMYLCSHMKDNDILLAYSFIRVYKDLEYALQKSYLLHNDYLIKEMA